MKPVNKTVCSLAALAPLAMAQSANAGQRPNIIFFLVDDFGWTETSLPSAKRPTPTTSDSIRPIWNDWPARAS